MSLSDPRKTVVSTLLESRSPVLLVQSSDGAEALARKNGLTVADLLRPFAEIKEGASFRTSSSIMSLRAQRLRVIPAAEFGNPAWDASEAALTRAVAAEALAAGISVPGVPAPTAKPSLPNVMLSSSEDASRSMSKLKTADPAPWATAYRRTLGHTLRCLPIEQLESPAAILVVVSTSDPDPVKCVSDFLSPGSLPRPYSFDQYEPSFEAAPRIVILLSDKAAEKEPAGLTSMNAAAAVAAQVVAPAAVAASFLEAQAGVSYTHPLSGRKPVDPMAVIREVKQRFAGINVVGAFVNSHAAADVLSGTAPAPADVWGSCMLEPLIVRPTDLPVLSASSGQLLSSPTPTGAGDSAALAAASQQQQTLPVVDTLLRCALVPKRGCCLAETDVNGLRSMVRSFIEGSVIPALEQRLAALSNVGKQKTGLRGVLKSFIGTASNLEIGSGTTAGRRSGGIVTSSGPSSALTLLASGSASTAISGPVPGVSTASLSGSSAGFDEGSAPGIGSVVSNDVLTVCYPYAVQYAQTRLLADLQLFIGDTDGAATSFKILRDESKNDKTPAHYGAACEGLALSHLLRDCKDGGRDYSPPSVPSREAEGYLEQAANAYYRAAQASAALMPPVQGQGALPLPAASAVATAVLTVGGQLPSNSEAMAPAVTAALARRIALRLATRASLALAELQIGSSMHSIQSAGAAGAQSGAVQAAGIRLREVASYLRRVAQAEGDGSLAAAVMTEQAAYACLRMSPPSHRRAAYHFSTAGMLYGASGSAFAGLAVRCLLAAITAVGEDPAAQLKPVAGDPDALSESSPWALISDHLCLHAAQRLLQLGNADGAANTLCSALTTSAARLSPVVQKNMLKELVKAQILAQHAKKAGNVKSAVERWVKKEKSAVFDTTATAGAPVTTAEDKEYASAYQALEAAVPASVWESIISDAEKASEYASPGLPLVDNGSVQVVSWSNALAAGTAIREICSAGAPGMVAPADTAGAVPLMSASVASPALALWSTDAARLSASSAALQELGTGEGSVPGDGLWTGHLPGEGPVRPGETASGPGRNAWVRMQEGFVRDIKARDKAGGGDIFRTNGSIGGAAGAEGHAVDWRKTCQDAAIAAENEAEMAAKAHKSSAEGHGWSESTVGGMSGEGAAAMVAAQTDPLAAAPAMALTPYVLAGQEGVLPAEYSARRGSKAGVFGETAHSHAEASGGGAGEASLDDVTQDAVAFPGGPAAAAVAAAAAAGAGRTAPPLSAGSGSASTGSFRGLLPAGGLQTATPPGSARNLLAAQSQARPSGAAASSPSGNQNQLYHAAEFLSKAQERYAGEPLAVLVTLHNPTSVDLHMTSLRLVGEVKDAKAEGALTLQDVHASSGPGWSVASSGSHLAVMSLNLTVGAGESKTVFLPATPLAQGTMIIKGIAWRLSSTPIPAGPPGAHVGARYRHDFELKGPPLNDSKASKSSGARAVDRRLEAKVKPAREWAGVSVSGLDASWNVGAQNGAGVTVGETVSVLSPVPNSAPPATDAAAAGPPIPTGPPLPVHLPIAKTLHMWEGEVRPVRFSFRNAGTLPIASVWIRTTGGGKVILGTAGEEGTLDGLEGATLPLDLSKAVITGGSLTHVQAVASPAGQAPGTPSTPGTAALSAAEAGIAGAEKVPALPAGATATWTISMRAAVAGSHALRMLVLYSSQAASAITGRSIAAGSLRALRWVTRVQVLPCLSALVTCKPSSEEAGQYDLCLSLVNMSPPTAGAVVPTAGAGTAGAAPVTLPMEIPAVRIISDHWAASLVDVSSSSLVPTAVSGTGSIPAASGEGNKPLAYLWCRTYRYRLSSKASQPTMLVSQYCQPMLLPADPKGPAPGTVRGLEGLPPALLTVLRAGHGQQIVQGLIATARKVEHARRRAAEAADALPPTLRSIRMGKAGGEGEDGSGEDALADPLPSSVQALTRTLGLGGTPAGNTIGLLIAWTKPSSILAAVTKSEQGLPPSLSPSGFVHVPAIILGNTPSVTGAGSALRAAVLQLAALEAVQAAERAAAADAAHTGGTPVASASVPAPVRSLAPPPFGSTAGAGAGSTPSAGLGPFDRPTAPASSRLVSSKAVNGIAAAAAARAAAAATLPIAATLTLSVPPTAGSDGAHSQQQGTGGVLSPATAMLLLYHAGGSGPHGQEPLDLELRAGAQSLGGQDEYHPTLAVQGATINGALHKGIDWAGAAQQLLPVLKPGCRVAVHMQVLVDSTLPLERLKAEAEASLAIRLPGRPWLPLAL